MKQVSKQVVVLKYGLSAVSFMDLAGTQISCAKYVAAQEL